MQLCSARCARAAPLRASRPAPRRCGFPLRIIDSLLSPGCWRLAYPDRRDQSEGSCAQALPAGSVAGAQRRTTSSHAEAAPGVAAASAAAAAHATKEVKPRRGWLGLLGAGAVAAGAGAQMALAEEEADHGLHAPHYPWDHMGPFSSYDHSAIRRGHQVYQQVSLSCSTWLLGARATEKPSTQLSRCSSAELADASCSMFVCSAAMSCKGPGQPPYQCCFDTGNNLAWASRYTVPVMQVCAACHSVYQLHFRDLVGVAYTEEEAKAMALEVEVMDGPNDEGEQYERPGRLSDPLPRRALNSSQRWSSASTAAHLAALVGAGTAEPRIAWVCEICSHALHCCFTAKLLVLE